jgi:hypothetical protein
MKILIPAKWLEQLNILLQLADISQFSQSETSKMYQVDITWHTTLFVKLYLNFIKYRPLH